jgi:plasmid stabilization system protein ParE
MAKRQIIWQARATRSLHLIENYISLDKPETALKFIDSMIEFANSLGSFHSYALCRYKEYAAKGLGCKSFAHNYIIFYRVTPTRLYIVDIIHASRLK